MDKVHILLYYKFVEVSNPNEFMKRHLVACEKLGLVGKVLVAKEGINGSVAGTKARTEAYKQLLTNDMRFNDVIFKEELGESLPFKRMVVRVKNEIIRMDKEVDMTDTGEYIEPREFLKLYEDGKVGKDVIVLDARNDYEAEVGKFKGAIIPPIKNFRDFPDYVESEMQTMKDKEIVMYCTGGIRCEKASAYMKQAGFKNVKQLHGGVITFCQQYPNTVWDGSCFVFDRRMVSHVGQEVVPITYCLNCKTPCDLIRNCRNVRCNERLIMCSTCEESTRGCCSQTCVETYWQQCKTKATIRA